MFAHLTGSLAMHPHIVVTLRVIAFCFICYGSVTFCHQVSEVPLSQLASKVLPPEDERVIHRFDASQLVKCIWRGVPLFVGFGLFALSPWLATKLCLIDFWPIVACRLVLVVSALMALCGLLDDAFNTLDVAVRYRYTQVNAHAWLELLESAITVIPLAILWLALPKLFPQPTQQEEQPPSLTKGEQDGPSNGG
jgi:hypothetical protein